MRRSMLALLVVVGVAGVADAQRPPLDHLSRAGSLLVMVSGLRNKKGLVNVTLFDKAAGFPENATAAAYRVSVELKGESLPGGALQVSVPDVAPGRYAMIVLHDENSNMKMDKNLLGMPKEGYGVSNDARNRFGPPSFAEALFEVGDDSPRVQVPVRY
jgi:uncharacterized protein (DUF2141 family)